MPGSRKKRLTGGEVENNSTTGWYLNRRKSLRKLWKFTRPTACMRQNYEDQAACIWAVHDPKHRHLTQPAVTQGSSGKTGS